jgi:hypothetical protein
MLNESMGFLLLFTISFIGVGFGHVKKQKTFHSSLILVLGPSLIFAHYKASIKSSIYTSIRQLYIPDIVSGPILRTYWYNATIASGHT